MIAMTGAIIHAADNAAVRSEANCRPKCFVFHSRGFSTIWRGNGLVGARFVFGVGNSGVLEVISGAFRRVREYQDSCDN